ncbi:serine-aspartate repeat-containing protein F-like [Bactrocera neohumeralis]|uniref:serine-aspartate repeat-containing protein F-like n=1 Tax=Bactrocera neohumeralis TaxID=98809 RepID=UPI0021662182|nr:serine-aspartate repeat-containing protein F-like [Bactrocera neohumeralis]
MHKTDQANEGNIPEKEDNIEIYEHQRVKSLIEELLLQGENKVITEQLLNPNYYEKKNDMNANTATKLGKDDLNQGNLTDLRKQMASINTQTPELSTNVTPEGLLDEIENLVPIKNTTNFDNHKLLTKSNEATFNSTQNGTNHNSLNPPDTTVRHATISLHIYSTKEQNESGDHPIDILSMNIKNVGGNETLKQQLDFLQKNAENIKKQQHIVGENGVNILERTEYTNVDLTESALVNNINSNHENLTAIAATNYNQKVNQTSSTNVLAELPMPLEEPMDFNEEPVNSYAVPVLKDLTTTIKVGQQNESTNLNVASFYHDKLKLSEPPNQSSVKNESHQAEITPSDDGILEQQKHGTYYVTLNQPSNYSNELVNGTTSYDPMKLRQSPANPSKENQSSNSDDETSFPSNEELSQSIELMDIYGFSKPQKLVMGSLFEPSKPTISTSASSNTSKTANIEEAFKRLTEIFDEYSVPISSVLQQLSEGLEEKPAIANLPMNTDEFENSQKTQVFKENNERPDMLAASRHDESDSMELGYGSDYTIFQSQMNFSNFIRTKEVVSDESSSNQSLAHEVLDSDEGTEDKVPQSSQLKKPTTKYQSDEYGEGNESEHELNDTSATEYSNVNVLTANPAATETKVSTTKVMTLFDATATPFATDPMATIANEPANNLEHLEVAIGNDVGKEIENIDKTNEMQVETIHQQQHQHFEADTELLAENTNDKSAWVATGLQHISNTLSAQPGKTTSPESAEEEHKGVPKPEVMCNKTEIIKSEQYNKTNENETETVNEKADMISGGRVFLGRSLSYTISCHISKHEVPTTIVPVVHAANTTDEIDNNREKIIKNHEQLTITSADDSRNGLPVGTLKPLEAERTEQRTEMDGSGDKANEGVADVGVGSADTDGSGYYGVGNEEEGMESGENYYIDGVVHEIDGDTDADGDGAADVDDYVTGAASFHVNGIQSRVRQAAGMTAVAQLTTSLETDNDKTYEYDTRQPLQGGWSDKDVNFQSVEHVAPSVVNSKNTKQVDSSEGGADKDYQDDDGYDDNDGDDDDDDNDGNASIEAVEFVTSDYHTEKDSKYREAAHIGSVDREPNSIAVTADADATVEADNMLQYKLAKAEAAAVEAQENNENYNAELLKTETESTKLKNASGGVSDANSDNSEDDDDDDDGKGESADAADSDEDEDEEMADVSGIAADAEAEDSSAAATDPMIAVAAATKPNGDDVKSAQSNASR